MTEPPLVVGVMLTRNRATMAARAERAFHRQTYERRLFLPWPTDSYGAGKTIGEMRNDANREALSYQADIIVHWDDDDVSHPKRIAEQVKLLQKSSAGCVGYREILFWREKDGTAWLYSNKDNRYCIGTSLCYWANMWALRRFPSLPKAKGGTGEDVEWVRGLESVGVSSLEMPRKQEIQPRLVASIHAGNSQDYSGIAKSGNWMRANVWDAPVREMMKAK
jgi:hypothetical protein